MADSASLDRSLDHGAEAGTEGQKTSISILKTGDPCCSCKEHRRREMRMRHGLTNACSDSSMRSRGARVSSVTHPSSSTGPLSEQNYHRILVGQEQSVYSLLLPSAARRKCPPTHVRGCSQTALTVGDQVQLCCCALAISAPTYPYLPAGDDASRMPRALLPPSFVLVCDIPIHLYFQISS